MYGPDLNLLVALSVLLEEQSVARAARRLQLSPSAMSRTLARLRDATGDPLLVRAGRGLVATPHALELREAASALVTKGRTLLRPAAAIDLSAVSRTFTLRTSDGFVESFAPALIERVRREAPGVRLNFLHKADKDSTLLRQGLVDLETSVVEASMGPELRVQALFRDRLIGAIGPQHPLADQAITEDGYAKAQHVIVSRSGLDEDAVDLPFLPPNLIRQVTSSVSGFAAAITLARQSNLVATVPDRHTAVLREGMISFPLPVPTNAFTVSMVWHPRMDADVVHRWLRSCLRSACGQ